MAEEIGRATVHAEPEHRFVRLRAPLGVTSFGINCLVLEPGQRMRIHRHRNQEEVYLVIEGTLTMVIERQPHELGPGELIRVGPSSRRQLVNRGPGVLKLIALGGMLEHEHVARDAEAYNSWSEEEPSSIADVPLPEDLPAEERA